MFEFLLQRFAIGFDAVVGFGVEVVLEQVDQDVEDAFLHYTFPGNRTAETPARLLLYPSVELQDQQHRGDCIGFLARSGPRVWSRLGRLEAERI